MTSGVHGPAATTTCSAAMRPPLVELDARDPARLEPRACRRAQPDVDAAGASPGRRRRGSRRPARPDSRSPAGRRPRPRRAPARARRIVVRARNVGWQMGVGRGELGGQALRAVDVVGHDQQPGRLGRRGPDSSVERAIEARASRGAGRPGRGSNGCWTTPELRPEAPAAISVRSSRTTRRPACREVGRGGDPDDPAADDDDVRGRPWSVDAPADDASRRRQPAARLRLQSKRSLQSQRQASIGDNVYHPDASHDRHRARRRPAPVPQRPAARAVARVPAGPRPDHAPARRGAARRARPVARRVRRPADHRRRARADGSGCASWPTA